MTHFNMRKFGKKYTVTDHEKNVVVEFDTIEEAIAYIEENGKKQRKEE